MTTNKKTLSTPLIIAAILAVLIGLGAWWFLHNFERVTKTTTKLSKQARNNRFFAAELMLKDLGKPTTTELGRARLIDLPDTADAIVVNEIGKSFNDARLEAMIEWMKAGGHIITFVDRREVFRKQNNTAGGNRLLNHFGIYAYNAYDKDDAVADAAEEVIEKTVENIDDDINADANTTTADTAENKKTKSNKNPHQVTLNWVVNGESLTVQFDDRQRIVYHPDQYDEEAQDEDLPIENMPIDNMEECCTLLGYELTTWGENETSLAVDAKTNQNGENGDADNNSNNSDYNGNSRKNNRKNNHKNSDHIHMLQVTVGEGKLTALSSRDFMVNPKLSNLNTGDNESITEIIKNSLFGSVANIAQADNAYLLWQLSKDASHVWLMPSIDAPSFSQILWQRAHYAVISFMVLALAWLLWQMSRLGPIMPLVETSRRNLLEHLHAVGLFAWRTDKADHLLNTSRKHLKADLLRKHPSLKGLQASELCKELSKRLNQSSKNGQSSKSKSVHDHVQPRQTTPQATLQAAFSPQDIYEALFASVGSESEFISHSHQLKRLREAL